MTLKTDLANLMREKNPPKFRDLVRSGEIEDYLDLVVENAMTGVGHIDENRDPNGYRMAMEIVRAEAEAEVLSNLHEGDDDDLMI